MLIIIQTFVFRHHHHRRYHPCHRYHHHPLRHRHLNHHHHHLLIWLVHESNTTTPCVRNDRITPVLGLQLIFSRYWRHHRLRQHQRISKMVKTSQCLCSTEDPVTPVYYWDNRRTESEIPASGRSSSLCLQFSVASLSVRRCVVLRLLGRRSRITEDPSHHCYLIVIPLMKIYYWCWNKHRFSRIGDNYHKQYTHCQNVFKNG